MMASRLFLRPSRASAAAIRRLGAIRLSLAIADDFIIAFSSSSREMRPSPSPKISSSPPSPALAAFAPLSGENDARYRFVDCRAVVDAIAIMLDSRRLRRDIRGAAHAGITALRMADRDIFAFEISSHYERGSHAPIGRLPHDTWKYKVYK